MFRNSDTATRKSDVFTWSGGKVSDNSFPNRQNPISLPMDTSDEQSTTEPVVPSKNRAASAVNEDYFEGQKQLERTALTTRIHAP